MASVQKNLIKKCKIFINQHFCKILLIRISQKVYKEYHAKKKGVKFACVVELAKLKFTYITVLT